jgi:hypothetical protein
MNICLRPAPVLILLVSACTHDSHLVAKDSYPGWTAVIEDVNAPEEGARNNPCSSVSARIWALIEQGQFAEALALIAEAKASGLIAAPLAARMLDKISLLNTRVGQLPATLQRVRNFPSQLKDYTLLEVKQMLERKDFSLATQAQLQMVSKIIKNPDRLMENH